jgi:dynein heavy chain
MDKQLQLFSATLDSWLLVQRGWLKLEAVFAAPDIQRQVPAEAAAFAHVDKTFKDIMRKTHDRPNALQVDFRGLLDVVWGPAGRGGGGECSAAEAAALCKM